MSVCQSRLGLGLKGPGLLCKEFGLYLSCRNDVSKVLKQLSYFEGRIVILSELALKNMFTYRKL